MQNFFGMDATMLAARLLAFITAIPFHETAHAYVSDKLGDHTARNLGRLSLNPIKHIDPFGLIAMLTIGVGWAKPVPINPANYKNRRTGMAITAAAGPLSNLLLGYFFMLMYKAVFYRGVLYAGAAAALPAWLDVLLTILYMLSLININLAVFNMLPVPPFDGSRIFGLVLPEKWYFAVQKYERYVLLVMVILLWRGVFTPLLTTVNGAMMAGLDWATGYVDVIGRWLLGV